MKTIFSLFFIALAISSYAQFERENNLMAEVGVGGGVSSDKEILANFQLGAYKNGNHVFFNLLRPFSDKINSTTAAGIRYGRDLGPFEGSVGADYHFLNEQPQFNRQRGWKFAVGVAYKPEPFFIAIGSTGSIFYVTLIGIFKRK